MASLVYVVLVNGLTVLGDSESSELSLRPLISDRFPNVRVKSYDFLPSGKRSLGDGGLQQRAEEILRDLIKEEQLSHNYDPGSPSSGPASVIFLSHSLGGCLVKKILLRAAEYWEYRSIAIGTKILVKLQNDANPLFRRSFFFGSPHRSQSRLQLERNIFRILSVSKLEQVNPLALLQEITLALSDLEEDLPAISGNYEVVNFFEQKATSSDGPQVLDEYSSTINSYSGENIGVSCNHNELWQFRLGELRTESILQKIETLANPISKSFNSQYHKFLRFLYEADSRTPGPNLSRVAPGSTDWISSNHHFLNWKTGPGTRVLHICGTPGSGTTMSSSHIAKLLKSDLMNKDVTFISFSFSTQDAQSCQDKSLFLSLSRQLLSDQPAIFRQTSSLCAWLMDQPILTREGLWALFRSLLMSSFRGPIFCIITGVDKCGSSWQSLVKDLAHLESSEQIPLKFLLTSETPLDIAPSWRPDPYLFIDMNKEREMDSAIRQFIKSRLTRLVQAKPVWEEFEEQIIEKLCHTNSTYFLVMQQMDYLESPMIRSTKAIVRKRISNLPSTLPTAYASVLNLISMDRYDWAVTGLSWIVHALRPLKECELAVALALQDKEIKSLESLRENISCDIMGDMTQLVGPLIKISDGRLYPIHRTVRILENLSQKSAQFHKAMLSTCLGYLSIILKSREFSQKGRDHSQVACSPDIEFCLLRYAVLYWPEHYKHVELNSTPGLKAEATMQSEPSEDVSSFLSDTHLIQTWSNIYKLLSQLSTSQYEDFKTPLNVASRFGLIHVVEKSLDLKNSSVSADNLGIALNIAAQYGHIEIVKRLLSYGATSEYALGLAASGGHDDVMKGLFNVNSNLEIPDSRGCTPLIQAAISGHLNAILTLLSRGASPDAKTLDGSTALHFSARIGQIAAVEALINKDADQDACDLTGFVPLHLAAEGGFADVVMLLLEHGGPVGKKTMNGDIPLHLAVTAGHLLTCEVLLNYKANTANPTSPNNLGLTPLHLASKGGYLPIVKLLFDHGASLQHLTRNAADIEDLSSTSTLPLYIDGHENSEISPLQFAARNGHLDVLRMLLAQGAETQVDNDDPQYINRYREYQDDINLALLVAAEAGHLCVVRHLIERNVDPTITDDNGNTALHLAVMANSSGVVAELVEAVTVDAVNNEGQTSLHLAAESGNVGITRLLIDHDAQVTRKTNIGDSPLHLAAKNGHVLTVRALQIARNTSSMLNNEDRTAVSLAVLNGHIGVVKELFEEQRKEAQSDGQSDNNSDLLHEVVRIGSEAILQMLLESGFSCSIVNKKGDMPIHIAAREGHSTIIELLIKSGAYVNARNSDGRTPLILAAENGKLAACEALLEAEAEIDAENLDGETSLFRASTRGYPDIVETLLKRHADVKIKNQKGWTALHAAIDSKDRITIINLLLDSKADPNIKNEYGSTPIILAAQDGRTDAVHLLLQAGANAKAKNSSGSTSLHRAAGDGHLETVKVLVEEGGADCNCRKSDGSTALYMAAKYGHTSVVKYLIRHTVDINGRDTDCGSPLTASAMVEERNKDGYLSTAKLLINKGADVNAHGGPYYSALQTAAFFGSLEMVQLLLYNKADVNSTGGRFGTALDAAIEREHLEIINILLRNNADPNIRFGGYTALKLAIDGANLKIVEALLKYGANPDLPIQEDDTALYAAARGDLLEIFKVLVAGKANLKSTNYTKMPILTDAIGWYSPNIVEYLLSTDRIDINEKDSMGRSPLMFSILSERGGVEELLNAGADPNTTDSEGKTPLIHAIMMGDEGLAETLLEKKANLRICDGFGRGPLYWACYFGNEELFETILKALEGHPDREVSCNLAIHAAAAKNQIKLLSKLLEDGEVDPNQRDRNGWTPLFTAKCYGFVDVETQLYTAEIAKPMPHRQQSFNVLSPRSRDTSSRSRRRRRRSPEPRSPTIATEDLSLESPTRWDSIDKFPLLTISDSGLTVAVESGKNPGYIGELNGMVRANHCMPANRSMYYFEVTIEKGMETPGEDTIFDIGIGFCEEGVPLNDMVGWKEGSWGFHGDDGKLYEEYGGGGRSYDKVFTEGVVIGCGINFIKSTSFFTRNGEVIGLAFSNIRGKLYPAVSFGVTEAKACVSVNFGNDDKKPLLYMASSDDEATYKPRRTINSQIEDEIFASNSGSE